MAALMQMVLTRAVSPEDLVKWLQKEDLDTSTLAKLEQFTSLRQDFIPYFLNFMRDSTLHLIENGLSMSQSPTKSSSTKKLRPEQQEQRVGSRSRRGHLFGSDNTEKNRIETAVSSSAPTHNQRQNGNRVTGRLSFRSHQHTDSHDLCKSGSGLSENCSTRSQRQRNSSSTLSCTSLADDSIIAGSSDTDYCSSKSRVNDSSLVSEDSSPDIPVLGLDQGAKTNYAGVLENKRNNGLRTPNAHSTPDRRRSGGRSTKKLSLGEFLTVSEQSALDVSSPDRSVSLENRSGGRHSSGKKKKNKGGQRHGLQSSNQRRSNSFCIESLDEFPPVCSPGTPESVQKVRPSSSKNGPVEVALFTDHTPVKNPSPVARIPPPPGFPRAGHAVSSKQACRQSPVSGPGMHSSDGRTSNMVQTKHALPRKACKHGASENGTTVSSDHKDTKHLGVPCESNMDSQRKQAVRDGISAELSLKEADSLPNGDQVHQQSKSQEPRRISLSTFRSAKTHTADPVFTQAPAENHHPQGSTIFNDMASCSVKTQINVGDGGDCRISVQEPGVGTGGVEKTKPFSQPAEAQNSPSPVKSCKVYQSVTPVKGLSRSSVLEKVTTPVTPDKPGMERSVSIIKLVQACPQEVTHRDVLDLLQELYSACLDAHLVPNLTMELYFITQLLTVQGSEDDEAETAENSEDVEDINYFKTVHNAVYFAVGVLEKQFLLVSQLDKQTLRLLSENERVEEFSSSVQQKLKNAFEMTVDRNVSSLPFSPLHGVSFQADTDNRKNFPNDRTFHAFRKQRDRFYEVLREWEANKQTPCWNMEMRLGEKIRGIVGSRTELANHLHLSRLFLSQLIATCKGAQRQWTKGDFENISLLMELKKTNPEKYLKLQDRFFRPFSCGGPCPPASFPGHQQFFHDFIVTAASPVFNQHLTNLLSARIQELNDADFGDAPASFDKQQMTTEDHETECEAFASTLLMVQLLSRFLGLITFLPYHSPDPLPQNLLQDMAIVRNSMSLPLDVHKYAVNAVKHGRLALTVPWIVEFLSLMDPVAPFVDCVRGLLQLLRQILVQSWHHLKVSGFSYSALLIVISLGWLFDQPCLPEGYFFTELPSMIESTQLSCAFAPDTLDCLSLVTQDLFYSCCPYFGEMRYLLTEFSVGAKSKTTVRKLNLVASDSLPPAPAKDTQKDIQLELQENFFHLHPASLRRTVEFVSERTASNFIKFLRASHVPDSIAGCVKEVTDLLSKMATLHTSKLKEKAQQEVPRLAQSFCTIHRNKMLEEQKEFCHTRIAESLKLLLPEDHPEAVVMTATAIACRFAKARITNWVHTNVTVATYAKHLTSELERQHKALTLANKEKQTAVAAEVAVVPAADNHLSDKENEPLRHITSMVKETQSSRKTGLTSENVIMNNKLASLSQNMVKDSFVTSNANWKKGIIETPHVDLSLDLDQSKSISFTSAQLQIDFNVMENDTVKQDFKTSPSDAGDSIISRNDSESEPSLSSMQWLGVMQGKAKSSHCDIDQCGDGPECDFVQVDFAERGREKPMSELLKDGQDLLCNLMIYSEPVTEEEILKFFSDIHVTLSSGEEQPPQTIPCLASLTVQLPIAIVSYKPELWTERMPSFCVRLWQGMLQRHIELSALCTRLTRSQLSQTPDCNKHRMFDDFLVCLVKKGLLAESDVSVDAS